jgi:mRNA interferase MazF
MVISRFDVYLVRLDPAQGLEIGKTRPCLVVSPDDMNVYLGTTVVAPMTTGGRDYPSRIPTEFRGRRGHIVLDQLRTVDRNRLVRRLGAVEASVCEKVLQALQRMFAP